jgi:hypothetical protein
MTPTRIRACQRDDWQSHKKNCGKEKIAKKLLGTIHDPSWQYPDVSEFLSPVGITPDGIFPITNLGFGALHPSRSHSPALQRQVALLEGDRDADYYLYIALFDHTDHPIRVMIEENSIKMSFRIVRSDAMFHAEPSGFEAMAEYLIKTMADRPGLSRARILVQFESEYGGDMAAKVAAFVAKEIKHGQEPGSTYLERMGAAIMTMVAGGFPGLPAK